MKKKNVGVGNNKVFHLRQGRQKFLPNNNHFNSSWARPNNPFLGIMAAVPFPVTLSLNPLSQEVTAAY